MTTNNNEPKTYTSSFNEEGFIQYVEGGLKSKSLSRKSFNYLLCLINCFNDSDTRRKYLEELKKIKIKN